MSGAAQEQPAGPPDRGGLATGRGGLRRERWRRGLLGAIALLYVASVPWYRETGGEVELWLGLPDWVAVALLCYVASAVLNSIAWGLGEIRDEPPAGASREEPPA